MKVLMVRSKLKAEHVAEAEESGKRLFETLAREQPQGIRYATCRLPDGVTFISVLELEDGVDNPLPTYPEGRAFQENLKKWLAEPVISEPLTVFGSYRFF